MISDVLSEALGKIEQYEKNNPNVYADVAGEIDRVRTLMEALRVYLDLPPSDDLLRETLRNVLLGVDVAPVKAVLESVRDRASKFGK